MGVLEVWRRGLARFTRTDLDLIDALAELTGELLAYLDAFEATVRFASDLEAQIDEVRRRISDSDSAEQAESQLLATALDADDIDALARGLARATDGVAAIVDDAGTVMAASRPLSRAERALVSRAPSVLGSDPAVLAPGVLGCRVCVATTAATIVLLQHKVSEDHGLRLVGWGGLASALTLARVRLDRAMSGTRDDLLWEVTGDSGPTAAHLAAKLDLAGTRRVLLVRGPEATLAAVRHRLDEILGQPMSTIRDGTLLAIPSAQRATPEAISELLETRALPSGETLAAGLSSPRAPDRLRRARHEAEIALRVARSLGVRTAAYDGLGLLRLLLPVSEEDSPAAFAEELLGPVLEYDRRRSGELLKTLRMYLESDCVIAEAAGRLFVHPKTLRYRLSKVEALTGLDLASQRGRFDAQLALAILQAHSVARSQND